MIPRVTAVAAAQAARGVLPKSTRPGPQATALPSVPQAVARSFGPPKRRHLPGGWMHGPLTRQQMLWWTPTLPTRGRADGLGALGDRTPAVTQAGVRTALALRRKTPGAFRPTPPPAMAPATVPDSAGPAAPQPPPQDLPKSEPLDDAGEKKGLFGLGMAGTAAVAVGGYFVWKKFLRKSAAAAA